MFERWTPHYFRNRYEATVRARSMIGSRSQIEYPGEGGLRPAVISRLGLQRADNADGIWTSSWQTCGEWKYDTVTKDYVQENCDNQAAYSENTFKEDINHLKEKTWIDGRTSLVYLTCMFTNRNIDMNATIRYTLEFTPSGLTRPEPPFIIAYEASQTSWRLFQAPLLYGFFQFASELMIELYEQSLMENMHEREGFRRFYPPTPSFSLHRVTEAITMIFGMATYYWLQARQWYTPSTSSHDEISKLSVMSESDCQNQYNFNYGMIVLLTCMRFIFMCDTIPRLNVIGRTLKLSFGPFAAFCVVFALLMYGFAVVFYLTYTSQIEQFDTIDHTLFTLFRGMLGDMPLDEMHHVLPDKTMIMYFVFCLIMLFTVFTILIAIISDAYERVMDDKEGQELDDDDAGAIAIFLRGGIRLFDAANDLSKQVFASGYQRDLGHLKKGRKAWSNVKKISLDGARPEPAIDSNGAHDDDHVNTQVKTPDDDYSVPTMGGEVSTVHPRNAPDTAASSDAVYSNSQYDVPPSPASPAAGLNSMEIEASDGESGPLGNFDPLDGPLEDEVIILSDDSFDSIHRQDRTQAARESRKQTWKNLKKDMKIQVV